MKFLQNPKWITNYMINYDDNDKINKLTYIINKELGKINNNKPVISIIIPCWNEEKNILNTIYSLSKQRTNVPFEIIVINNNSSDETQNILNMLKVRSIFKKEQGVGPSRQIGQENAKGKYILLADADVIYPEYWVAEMHKYLSEKKVVCVYGDYSFIGNSENPRWQFIIYEKLRKILILIRQFKRPYLNAYGMSMGYVRKFGLQVKFDDRNMRGSDGRLAFDLMTYGKIKRVKNKKAKVWTHPRTLKRDKDSLFSSLILRISKEVNKIPNYLTKKESHNTKISRN